MIQTYIYLPKTSYLFKTLKKKNLLEQYNNSPLFIWLDYKPNIGELIQIDSRSVSVSDEKLRSYLSFRNKPIIVRVIDLIQNHSLLKNDPTGLTAIHLKVYEDDSANWC